MDSAAGEELPHAELRLATSSDVPSASPAEQTLADTSESVESLLSDQNWSSVRRGLESFGSKPPSIRKLINQLKKMRDDGELEEKLSDDDLQLLVKECVEHGRIEKVSRGFATILRLKEQ